MRRLKLAAIAAAMAALLLLAGCGPALIRVEEPVKRTHETVQLQGAQRVSAEIRMGVGQLEIGGAEATGAPLLTADVTHRPADWGAALRYDVKDGVGSLTFEQPTLEGYGFKSNAYWQGRLAFDRQTPLDLLVRCGVGDTTVKLGELNVSEARVVPGVGKITIDLAGSRPASEGIVPVSISGGIGRVNLNIPRDVPVRIRVTNGVGESKLPEDFSGEEGGRVFTNQAYRDKKPGARIYELNITRGVGSLDVEER